MTNNVIGPIDAHTWGTMRDFKVSIKDYGDDPKFKIAKEKETRLLKYYLHQVKH